MNKLSKLGIVVAMLLALLPSLTSAEAPAPKGKLVYEDNFDTATKSQLEDNLSGADFSRGFHPPGVYHLKVLKPNQTQWVLFPKLSFSNLTLVTDIGDFSDDVKSGSVLQGLIFRAQDENHFYTVLLNSRNSSYTVRKLDGAGKWSDLVPSTTSALIKGATTVNTLRVDGDGGKFTIYVNGEQLGSFQDTSFASGKVGFIIANQDAKEPHIHYDNVKVYTTDAQPAALPNTGEGTTAPMALLGLLVVMLLGAGIYLRRAAR
jgi:LPXTG-motif cell wall-anchored protein